MTIEDLPRLLAGVVEVDADRIALTVGDTTVTYARLKQEIENLDAAMGGVLGIDALVPVVLSTVVPGLLEAPRPGDCPGCLNTLFADAAEVLGDSATAAPAGSAQHSRRCSTSRSPVPPTRSRSSSTAPPSRTRTWTRRAN
ncbi:hypothetical protein GTA07_28000, partial [Rhodococcus hoagii]|nr:hypothetical protein [Prescottella equi]